VLFEQPTNFASNLSHFIRGGIGGPAPSLSCSGGLPVQGQTLNGFWQAEGAPQGGRTGQGHAIGDTLIFNETRISASADPVGQPSKGTGPRLADDLAACASQGRRQMAAAPSIPWLRRQRSAAVRLFSPGGLPIRRCRFAVESLSRPRPRFPGRPSPFPGTAATASGPPRSKSRSTAVGPLAPSLGRPA
jgi:hypothetical protein